MSEFNSAEMAGGKAIGLSGEIRGFNADVEARIANILMDVGRWVERESGALMGHIKIAVAANDQTETINLTDLQEGVLFHGKVRPCRVAEFSFMAAVLDVNEGELEHITLHAFEDSGINLTIEGHSHAHHHHDHGEGCTCGCHDHEHHHHHDDDGHHHHEHGEDCGCGCHDHEHHHHHDDDDEHHHHHGGECHCHDE